MHGDTAQTQTQIQTQNQTETPRTRTHAHYVYRARYNRTTYNVSSVQYEAGVQHITD